MQFSLKLTMSPSHTKGSCHPPRIQSSLPLSSPGSCASSPSRNSNSKVNTWWETPYLVRIVVIPGEILINCPLFPGSLPSFVLNFLLAFEENSISWSLLSCYINGDKRNQSAPLHDYTTVLIFLSLFSQILPFTTFPFVSVKKIHKFFCLLKLKITQILIPSEIHCTSFTMFTEKPFSSFHFPSNSTNSKSNSTTSGSNWWQSELNRNATSEIFPQFF